MRESVSLGHATGITYPCCTPMDKAYTTQDLIEILQSERRACLRGERLHLTAAASSGIPVIDQLLKTEGIQKYSAYQGFKSAVHHYQRQHQVSGLVWRQVAIQGQQLSFPAVHHHLMALPEDVERMRQVLPEILDFWSRLTEAMELYLAVNRGKDFVPIAPEELGAIAQRTEWATLQAWQRHDFLEILLQLGWGQPAEAEHWRAWPTSGSEYVHAVRPGFKPVC